MDMSNATAAGPSYGLLDVLFGTAGPKEGKESVDKEFMPLMDLIRAMNDTEEKENLSSRTEEDTAAGKDGVEYSVVGTPVWFPTLPMAEFSSFGSQNAESAVAKSGLGYSNLSSATQLPVDPNIVNKILEEKSLPPLTKEEKNILAEVNKKLLNADLGKTVQPNSLPTDTGSEMVLRAGRSFEQTQSERKHVEQLVKSALEKVSQKSDTVSALEEKFLPTETYLKIHEKIAKGGPRGEEKLADSVVMEGKGIPVSANINPEASSQEDSSQQRGQMGKSKDDFLSGMDSKKLEKESKSTEGFLPEFKVAEASIAKEITIPSGEPDAARSTILKEVDQGVSFQALKGGGEVRLIIHPEELGEIKLQIESKNGSVEVKVITQNEDVAKIIRSGSDDLSGSLKDKSLALTRFEVTVSDTAVSSSDLKKNLGDQFLQQQPNQPATADNLSQGSMRQERGFSGWEGAQSGQRDGSDAYRPQERLVSEEGRKSPSVGSLKNQKDSNRRIDVVA